jgi:hypothetical protein
MHLPCPCAPCGQRKNSCRNYFHHDRGPALFVVVEHGARRPKALALFLVMACVLAASLLLLQFQYSSQEALTHKFHHVASSSSMLEETGIPSAPCVAEKPALSASPPCQFRGCPESGPFLYLATGARNRGAGVNRLLRCVCAKTQCPQLYAAARLLSMNGLLCGICPILSCVSLI